MKPQQFKRMFDTRYNQELLTYLNDPIKNNILGTVVWVGHWEYGSLKGITRREWPMGQDQYYTEIIEAQFHNGWVKMKYVRIRLDMTTEDSPWSEEYSWVSNPPSADLAIEIINRL